MLSIRFREPLAPRYIYVNPENNQVHLLMPIVNGKEIGIDNTSQTVMALKVFFGKNAGAAVEQQSALSELKRYQRALQFDMSWIQVDSPLKRQKMERLEQIQRYIGVLQIIQTSPLLDTLNAVFPDYPQPIKERLSQNTNIYSMRLHPRNPDSRLRAVKPIFTVDRDDAQTFYRNLKAGYIILNLIDDDSVSLGDAIPSSLFNIQNTPQGQEQLSILTQFFLAQVNIYCYANDKSHANFGEVLDRTPALSQQVPVIVKHALQERNSVEQALFDFINTHPRAFGLQQSLAPSDLQHILHQFIRQFNIIKDSAHFDEFILFQSTRPGCGVGHQGAICIDLADLICTPAFHKLVQPYFTHIHECSRMLPRIVPDQNEWVQVNFEIEEAALQDYLQVLIQRDENFDALIELLIADTDNGEKVFQRLDMAVIDALQCTPSWSNLKNRVAQQITDPAIQLAFNARFVSHEVQFTITNAMANSIYVAANEVRGPDAYSANPTVLQLQASLCNFLATQQVTSVLQSAGNGFVLTLPQANIRAIQDMIARNQDRIYLTPAMAENIYREATAHFGVDSLEITQMNRLSNTGPDKVHHKLLEALKLLGIHIVRSCISFPANSLKDHIVFVTPLIQQTIADIQQNQSRFHLTVAMTIALYQRVDQMGLGAEIAQLSNAPAPDKIRRTLALLDIPQTNLSYNEDKGYWVNISSQSEQYIRDIEARRLPPPARVLMTEGGTKRVDVLPVAAIPGAIIPLVGREVQGGAKTSIPAVAPPQQLRVDRVLAFRLPQALAANAARVQLNCPDVILQTFRQLLAGAPALLGCSFVNPYMGMLETLPVDAAGLTARHLQILARNEQINTTGVMQVALYGGKLTHDQIGRLRCLVKATNVSGVVLSHATGGFNGSPRVMHNPGIKTIIIDQSGLQWQGDFYNTGGLFFYPNHPQAPQLPPGYTAWQTQMVQALYAQSRPVAPAAQSMAVRWLGVEGRICLSQLAMAIDTEFSQSLEAAVAQGDVELAAHERINFKFLKAGMGAFAAGLEGRNQVQLEHARLYGIEQALQRIVVLPTLLRCERLGKIGRIELPFSGNVRGEAVLPLELGATLARIQAHVLALRLEWGGTPTDDALIPRVGFVNAITNCGNPHAMIGNEGGHEGVNGSIATNCELQHLNPGYNAAMQLRASPLCAPTVIWLPAAVLAIPVSAVTIGAAALKRLGLDVFALASEALKRFGLHAIAGETVLASVGGNVAQSVDSLKQRIISLAERLQEAGQPRLGALRPLEEIANRANIPLVAHLELEIWKFGRSSYSGNLCFSSAVVQIELKRNGDIAIRDKRNQYAEIRPSQREYLLALTDLSNCFPQLQEAPQEVVAVNGLRLH